MSRIDIEDIKKIWRKSKYIRPAFWACYKRRPSALYRRARTDHRLDKVYPSVYLEAAKEKVDERKVVFYDPRYRQICASMRLLYDRMSADPRFDVHFVRANNDENDSPEEKYERNKRLAADLGTAKYIFCSDASRLLGCLPIRKETVYVQLWHACGAFKGFGMSTANLNFGGSMKRRLRHPGYKNTDIVTVSSPEVCWAYAEAMALPKERIYPIGVSRTDVFYQEQRLRDAYETVYAAFPAARGKKIILFAPTFRGHIRTATSPMVDVERFAEAFQDEYVLIAKHHPVVKELPQLPERLQGTFAFDATGQLDIEDLLIVSDICITDYSSLIFEYSLMLRPMLFYAFDLEDYYDWRGFYYPYDELTPGPVCRTNEEMIEYITHIDENFDVEQMKAFRDKFMSACDGHATERILETALALGREKAGTD